MVEPVISIEELKTFFFALSDRFLEIEKQLKEIEDEFATVIVPLTKHYYELVQDSNQKVIKC